jgi:hypothetical protein
MVLWMCCSLLVTIQELDHLTVGLVSPTENLNPTTPADRAMPHYCWPSSPMLRKARLYKATASTSGLLPLLCTLNTQISLTHHSFNCHAYRYSVPAWNVVGNDGGNLI